MNTLDDAVAALSRLGCNPVKSGDGYAARCPLHEAKGSHSPSLTLAKGDKQPVVVRCHAGCDSVGILKALAVDGPERTTSDSTAIVATYSYVSATGELLFEKLRKADKRFTFRHRPAQGGDWVWKQPKLDAFPLYHLPDVQQAIADGRTLFFCEGEKDADRLKGHGLVATTNKEGASKPEGKPKWRPEYTEQLTGAARVILLPDNDEPGRAHMQNIALQLRGKVKEIRFLELPGLPEKGDVSDWLDAGNTVENLKMLAQSAPEAEFQNNNNNKYPSFPSFHSESITLSFRHPSGEILSFRIETKMLEEKGEPLPDSEVARRIAKSLKGRLAFCRESLSWHCFTGTHWHPIPLSVPEEWITKLLYQGIPSGFKASLLKATLCLLTNGLLPLPQPDARQNLIPFTNGLLDLSTRTLRPATPEAALTWSLPYAYEPSADCPTIRAWLLSAVSNDPDAVQFLRAWLAGLLTGRSDLQKFLHLLGPGGTGKGAFIRLASALIGRHNTTITDLRNLEQNRFETAGLYQKRLVAITDSGRYSGGVDVFKAMTGQDPLRLERKHQQQSATFTFEGMVILASNEGLTTNDYTSALERRRLTVQFNQVASPDERAAWDAQGGESAVLHTEIPGLVNWLLELSRADVTRLIMNPPRHTAAANLEALQFGNPIADWLMTEVLPAPGQMVKFGVRETKHESGRVVFLKADEHLYPNYLRWCERNGRTPIALRRLSCLVIELAKMLKLNVTKDRKETGIHLIGLKLRGEFDKPHPWNDGILKDTSGFLKDAEGCLKDQLIDSEENEGYEGRNSYFSARARAYCKDDASNEKPNNPPPDGSLPARFVDLLRNHPSGMTARDAAYAVGGKGVSEKLAQTVLLRLAMEGQIGRHGDRFVPNPPDMRH